MGESAKRLKKEGKDPKPLQTLGRKQTNKTEEEEALPNSFYEASISQTPKLDRHHRKRPISLMEMEMEAISSQSTNKWNLTTYEKDYTSRLSGIYPKNARFNVPNINEIPHIQKEQNHSIISRDTEKAFNKIQHFLMLKT